MRFCAGLPVTHLGLLEFDLAHAGHTLQLGSGHDFRFIPGINSHHVKLDVVEHSGVTKVDVLLWANKIHDERPRYGRKDVNDVPERASGDHRIVNAPHRIPFAQNVALQMPTEPAWVMP